jgi:GH18 family chitinase
MTHLVGGYGCYVTSASNPTLIYTLNTNEKNKAHTAGLKYLLNFGGETNLTAIMNVAANRNQLVANLAALVNSGGFDGLQVDWEDWNTGAIQQSVYHQFLVALRTALPSAYIMPCVPADIAYGWVNTSDMPYIDALLIMCYGGPGADQWGTSYSKFTSAMGAWVSAGYPTRKLLAGIPLYTDDAGDNFGGYNSAISQFNLPTSANSYSTGNANGWSGSGGIVNKQVVGGVLYLCGVDQVNQKCQWVKTNNFGGVFLWVANWDMPSGSKSVLDACYNSLILSEITTYALMGGYDHSDPFGVGFNQNWGKMTHFVTGYGCYVTSATNPALIYTLDATEKNKAHTAGCKYLLGFGEGPTAGALNAIMHDATKRSQLVANLATLVNDGDFDGIQVDWEDWSGGVNNADYHAFLVLLRATLPSTIIMPCVPADIAYGWITTNDMPYVDYLMLMIYGGPGIDMNGTSMSQFTRWAQGWLDAGFPSRKLIAGIPVYSDDANDLFGAYYQVINQFSPAVNQNIINASTANGFNSNGGIQNGKAVIGGKIYICDVTQTDAKCDWVVSHNMGGVYLWVVNWDMPSGTYSLLDKCYYTLLAAEGGQVFAPGSLHNFTVPITVTPAGIACTCEIYLGPDINTKTATSGARSFTSTGVQQNVTGSVTMPVAGTYHTYATLKAKGVVLGTVYLSDIIVY